LAIALTNPARGRLAPARRIEQRLRRVDIEREQGERRVRECDGARKRAVGQQTDLAEHILQHCSAVERHRERAADADVTEDRVWSRGILRVDLIEAEKRVLEVRIGCGTQCLAAVDQAKLVHGNELQKISLPPQQLSERCSGIGDNAPDDPIELRTAPVVRRVGDELDALARVPADQSESTAADAPAGDLRFPEILQRNVLQQMLRHHVQLVDHIVELLRPVLLVPDHRRQRVSHRNRIDVRNLGRRSHLWIREQAIAEANVARANRLAIVPPGAWVDMERDRQ
jgi:hypothetical protein